jgi:PAS domain S-box-containing protein
MKPPGLVDQTARVLIVDDERCNRDLLEVMLAADGFQVQAAASGEEALAMVAHQPPDLILLDVMMPGLDGYEVTARIKNEPSTRNIPIIMVTALDDRSARMRGLNAGAEDFLSKPVDRAELSVRVRNLLRLKAYSDYYGNYSQVLEGQVASRTAELVEQTTVLEGSSAALRESDERTNFALRAAHMGVWQLDFVNDRLTWSETMAPVFGVTSEQAPTNAESFLALVQAEDRQAVQASIAGAARKGTDFEVEFRVVWPDGGTHWISGLARIIRNEQGEPSGLLGVAIDISDRKSLEGQFRQAQKMDAVGQLAGGVAHDFNNLLTAILCYSDFVMESFDADDPRRHDLEEVTRAGHRAAGLTKQLLAFSRKQLLQPTALDLNALVSGMHQMMGRLIGEHIDLVPLLAADLGVVRADHGQIEQVLMNLVVNARDAMMAGGRLTIETANVNLDQSFMRDVQIQPGPYVMLAVSDSGSGMSDATKQRLFEPFFTTKEVGKGTGLGLATVYGIVKQSGGYVWVHSELGKGTTFKVYLPRTNGADELETKTTPAETMAAGSETVFVVEDEEPVRVLACRILERAGYQVLDAATPAQADTVFEEHKNRISLLLADVIMPGSTGPELFARLEGRRPGLRVLYMSGYTADTIVHQGQLEIGAALLQKPFTAEGLNRKVREILDQ